MYMSFSMYASTQSEDGFKQADTCSYNSDFCNK
jgi:hypothetical protein